MFDFASIVRGASEELAPIAARPGNERIRSVELSSQLSEKTIDFFLCFFVVFFSAVIAESGETYRTRKALGLNETSIDIDNETLKTGADKLPLNGKRITNCTPAAILELPSDGFTREQRQSGWIVIHVLLACYCFWLLATICDDYFVPAIETICSCKW